MTRVTYLLSKDPTIDHGGDIALSRIMIELTKTFADVTTVCLSTEPDRAGEPGLVRVRKGTPSPWHALVGVARRRSIVHERFDSAELRAAITDRHGGADVWVAEHSYMAESYLRARDPGARFVINTVNTESQVWRATRGTLGRLEAPRILRDEVRVARAADAVGTYDQDEAQMYRDHGAPAARWIDLTIPPGTRLDREDAGPRLVFMGTRDWPPNQEAFEIAVRMWPRIAAGIDGAELYVIGAPAPGVAPIPLPDGVHDIGFVDDLHGFLSSCRALIAPVATGGGVRVKILEAASRGLPVIGTGAAIGSLGSLFELPAFDDTDAFVQECRRYLLDADHALARGRALYDVNAAHWADGVPAASVRRLVCG